MRVSLWVVPLREFRQSDRRSAAVHRPTIVFVVSRGQPFAIVFRRSPVVPAVCVLTRATDMDELLARITRQIDVPKRMGAPALVAHLLTRAVFHHVVAWVTPNDVFTVKDWSVLTAIYNNRSRLPTKEPPVTIEKFKEILVGRRGPNVIWVEPMEPPYFRLHRMSSVAHRATAKSGDSVRLPS